MHGGGILSILTQYSRLQIWFIKIIKIIKIKTWRPESDYFTLLFYSLSEFILNPGLAPDGFGLPMRVWRMESVEEA